MESEGVRTKGQFDKNFKELGNLVNVSYEGFCAGIYECLSAGLSRGLHDQSSWRAAKRYHDDDDDLFVESE